MNFNEYNWQDRRDAMLSWLVLSLDVPEEIAEKIASRLIPYFEYFITHDIEGEFAYQEGTKRPMIRVRIK